VTDDLNKKIVNLVEEQPALKAALMFPNIIKIDKRFTEVSVDLEPILMNILNKHIDIPQTIKSRKEKLMKEITTSFTKEKTTNEKGTGF
jgi:hypothetical protein